MKTLSTILTTTLFASITVSAAAAESAPIKRHRTRTAAHSTAGLRAGPSTTAAAPNSPSVVHDAAGVVAPGATERQHTGFYGKAELGLGYRSFGTEVDGTQTRLQGLGAALSLQLGGAIVPNLVLFGEGTVSNVVNPTLTIGDDSIDTTDVKATLVGVGPGFAYYLMPLNAFFGASVLLTRLSMSHAEETIGRTDWGFGGTVRLGKEWWLRPGQALGVVAQYTLSSMKDQNGGPAWLANSVSLSASYTYN